MLIDQRAREIVAYVVEEDFPGGASRKTEIGTCFFVGTIAEPLPGCEVDIRYAVTAGHVIEGVLPGNELYIRINLKAGGWRDVLTDSHDWLLNPSTDVAVYRMRDWSDDLDVHSIAIGFAWTGSGGGGPSHGDIFVGDEVASVGLFAQHPGNGRNEPVVRFGHISLMPHSPISVQITESGPPVPIEAFVVEMTAWGGQSGSPVFLFWPHFREWGAPDKGERGPWLLGLIQGNFVVEEELDRPDQVPGDWIVRANAGLTIVVPASDIFSTLNNLPAVRADRDQLVNDRAQAFLNGH